MKTRAHEGEGSEARFTERLCLWHLQNLIFNILNLNRSHQ